MLHCKPLAMATMFVVGISLFGTTAEVVVGQIKKQDSGRSRAPSRAQSQPRAQTRSRPQSQPRTTNKPKTSINKPQVASPQRTVQPPTSRKAPIAGNKGVQKPTITDNRQGTSRLQPRTSKPPVNSGNAITGGSPQKLQFGNSGKTSSEKIVAPNRSTIGNANSGGKPNRLQFGDSKETLSTKKPLNQGNVVGSKPLTNRSLSFGDRATSPNLGTKPLAGSQVTNPGKKLTGSNLQNRTIDLRGGNKPEGGKLTDIDTTGGKQPVGERPTLVGSQRLNRRLGMSGTFVPPPLPGLPQAAPATTEQLDVLINAGVIQAKPSGENGVAAGGNQITPEQVNDLIEAGVIQGKPLPENGTAQNGAQITPEQFNDLIEAGLIQAKPLPENPVPVNPDQPFEELGDVGQGKPGLNDEVVEGPTDPRLDKPEGGFPDLDDTALDKPGKPGVEVEDPGDRVEVVIIDEVDWNHNYPDYCNWWWHFCPTVRYCPPGQCVTYNCGQVLADYTLESGEVIQDVRWWLGVTGMALPKVGFGVEAVEQGSPAEEVGLEPGMIITHANGIELVDADALAQAIEQSNGVLEVKVLQDADGPAAEATIQMVQVESREF